MDTQSDCDNFNDESEFFTEYRVDSNGEIYLANANDIFLFVKGLSPDMIGKNINDVCSPDEISEIVHYLEISRNEDFLFNMLREMENQNFVTVWKTCITANGTSVKIIGECIFSFHHEDDNSDCSILTNYQYDSFINRHIIGFGTIDCSSPEQISFIELNPLLTHLAANHEVSLDSLLKCHAIQKAIKIKSSCRGYYRKKNSYGIEIIYTVDALPVISKGKIKNIMLTVIPSSSSNCMNINILKKLTVRESEVAMIAAKGYPNKYIAHILHISEGTVKKTLSNCYKKMGISSKVEMIQIFSRQ